MEPLDPKGRQRIVEEICTRFHEDGISRLEVVGHFEKYIPLYHFRIAEPNDGDFIFITELFGNVNCNPAPSQNFRMQYHGNYDGLSRIILQGLYNDGTSGVNPSYKIHAVGCGLSDKEKYRFDMALRYINNVLRLTIPETRRFDVDPETFSRTFDVD